VEVTLYKVTELKMPKNTAIKQPLIIIIYFP